MALKKTRPRDGSSSSSGQAKGPGMCPCRRKSALAAGVSTVSIQSVMAGDQPGRPLAPQVTSYWKSPPSVTCRSR